MLPVQFESPYNRPKPLVQAIRHASGLRGLPLLPRTKVPNPFQVSEFVKRGVK
jgi:hypothetical protein